MILTILIFLLILSILVFVHEAGHFFVAKWSGIKVEEFGFGLPPRAWGKKVGETIYSINWLPFGGFVKLFGEDDAGSGKVTTKQATQDTTPTDPSRAFTAKPLKNRVAVVVAGVFMNLILAITLFYIVLVAQGFKAQVLLPFDITHNFVGANQTNQVAFLIDSVDPNSPAQTAGLGQLDRIIATDGQVFPKIDDFRSYIDQMQGEKVTLTVLNMNDQAREVTIVPRVNIPPNQGRLGIRFGAVLHTAVLEYKSPAQKTFSGVLQTYNVGIYSGKVFGKVIAKSFKEKNIEKVREGVAGPIGIGRIVGGILDIGGSKALIGLLEFTALLSLNLAVVNILPFPALDGGRLLFLVIEGVTRRKVKPELERIVNTVGMAILLGLILLITFNDLQKIFG